MERIISDNIMIMNKIQLAQPIIQYADHLEHTKTSKKLRENIQNKSMRQSMTSTIRNYFVTPIALNQLVEWLRRLTP